MKIILKIILKKQTKKIVNETRFKKFTAKQRL